ncbi:hypothetical protein ACFLRH_00535 [Actinomycetota bacterium]
MAARTKIFVACVGLVVSACSGGATEPGSTSETAAPSSILAGPAAPPASALPQTPTSRPPLPLAESDLWAFPGPDHYEGDVLTFQVPIGGFGAYSIGEMAISVDGVPLDSEATLRGDPLLGDVLVFPNAFVTDGGVGGHWVKVTGQLVPEREIDITQRIVVQPAAGRPRQELAMRWAVERTECCNVSYLEESAAARDLDQVVGLIDESARRVEEYFGLSLPRVDLVLIDRLWGNGGYAGDEVVVSYLDRDYSPGRGPTLQQTVLHELAHAITDQIEHATPWPLLEGTAVHFAGGHFKPEPLGPRARALVDRGELPPLVELFVSFPEMQHETRYVAAGALVEYIVVTYGFPAFLDVLDSDLDQTGGEWLGAAVREALGIDLVALQTEFTDWVASHDAASQSEDLALTIALQEARRAFQAAYDPYPNYFGYPSVTKTGQDALAMRDPRSPRLVAVEALIGYAQDLIITGDFEVAAVAVAEVERVVAEGTVGVGLSAGFLEVAEALDDAGYELLEYVPGTQSALATRDAPSLTRVDWEIVDGAIVVTGIRSV